MHKLFNPSTTEYFLPIFGSGYIFELRNDTSGNYYVQVLLKNSKPNDPISINPVKIDGCDIICPLDQFVSLLKAGLITDYNAACMEKLPPQSLTEKITAYFNSIFSWIASKF